MRWDRKKRQALQNIGKHVSMQFTAVSINSSSLHAHQYCDTKQSFYYHWYIIIVFNISNLIIYIFTVFTLILKSLEVYLTEKSCLGNCWNKTRLIVFIYLISVNVYFILSNEYVNCLALQTFFIENNVYYFYWLHNLFHFVAMLSGIFEGKKYLRPD